MKKSFYGIPLLLILNLLLSGCEVMMGEQTEEISNETYHFAGAGEIPLVSDWENHGTEGNRELVKCLMDVEGEIPASWPVDHYSYRLPMIDLAGQEAMACNREIDERYGALIRDSRHAMERSQTPGLERLSYSYFVLGDILTLRIDRQDYKGPFSQAFFTVNAVNGEAVRVQQLLAAAGMEGEPEQLLNQKLTEYYVRRFGPIDPENLAYTTALNRTQSELIGAGTNQMHLTELGQLCLSLTVYQPEGGSEAVEILLP
ncbi:MAG: hypothetical protein J5878_06495 [Oscillospiraceae bacterium]|nr:hypothetical protein [Oscillospiraceae bacterium]